MYKVIVNAIIINLPGLATNINSNRIIPALRLNTVCTEQLIYMYVCGTNSGVYNTHCNIPQELYSISLLTAS